MRTGSWTGPPRREKGSKGRNGAPVLEDSVREKENQSPGGPHNLSENLWPRGGPVWGAHDLLNVRSSPGDADLQSVGRSNGAPNVNLWPRGGLVLAGAGREAWAPTSETALTSGETTPCKVTHGVVSPAPMAQGRSGRSGLVLGAHNEKNGRRGERSGAHNVENVLGAHNVKSVQSAHEAPNDVLRDLSWCLYPTPDRCGTYKTVKPRFWPWSEVEILETFQVVPSLSDGGSAPDDILRYLTSCLQP